MSSAADRKRRERQRRRDGIALYRIEVSEADLVEALIQSGVSEAATRRRSTVERELATILTEWSRRWLSGHM